MARKENRMQYKYSTDLKAMLKELADSHAPDPTKRKIAIAIKLAYIDGCLVGMDWTRKTLYGKKTTVSKVR